jgi:hypothetical protein
MLIFILRDKHGMDLFYSGRLLPDNCIESITISTGGGPF